MGEVDPFTGLYDGPVHWRRTLQLIREAEKKAPDVILVPPVLVPSTGEWGMPLPTERASRLANVVDDVEVHYATSPLQACHFRAHLAAHPDDARLLADHHLGRLLSAPRGKPLSDSALLCLHACATLGDYTRDPSWHTRLFTEYAILRHTDPATETFKDGVRTNAWRKRAAVPLVALQMIVAELAYLYPPTGMPGFGDVNGAPCILCGTVFRQGAIADAVSEADRDEYVAMVLTARHETASLAATDMLRQVLAGLFCLGGTEHTPFIEQCIRDRRGLLPFTQ